MPGTLPVLNKEAVHQSLRTALALGCQVHPVSRFERKHYFYCDLPQGYQITQQASPIATGGSLLVEPPLHENQRQRAPRKRNASSPHPGLEGDDPEEAAWPPFRVRIARLQIEQDSGKSTHDSAGGRHTLVDLNRAGVALMEIVFEPELSSPSQAAACLRSLQATLRALDSCDGLMEEGSLRCDLNVSVRPAPPSPAFPPGPWGPRVEVKNLNSLKALQTAAAFEIQRQIALHDPGDASRAGMAGTEGGQDLSRFNGHFEFKSVERETRAFNAATGETTRMRGKEGAVDYRFFPEPDLPPLVLDMDWVEAVRRGLPELPQATRSRLVEEHGLTPAQAEVLIGEGEAAVGFFEDVVRGGGGREGRGVANWVCNDLIGLVKAKASAGKGGKGCAVVASPYTSSPALTGQAGASPTASYAVHPEAMGELIDMVSGGEISIRTGKEVLALMVAGGSEDEEGGGRGGEKRQRPREIVAARGWGQVSDETVLIGVARNVVRDPGSARQRRQYKEGKEKQMMKFFVGQAMKETGGRAHPGRMETLLRVELRKAEEEEMGGK
ncbi:glutamyl-trna b subunit [Nannochloropsis gaditana]|uniref:Glutamyl-tRNA(Gln) amidotransferase subunit B, mitochondrial n=2 Tax=Nannochloropsis gaditana TaxID=72520 RepID=W7TQ61_9STRA|nr:glutamyl-trna b subunit [Nannochloropsis gaditana]